MEAGDAQRVAKTRLSLPPRATTRSHCPETALRPWGHAAFPPRPLASRALALCDFPGGPSHQHEPLFPILSPADT